MNCLNEGDLITVGTVNKEEGNRVELLKDKKVSFLDGDEAIFKNNEIIGHSSYGTALKFFPEIKDYYSFGVLRNPFDRCVSSFRWIKKKRLAELLETLTGEELSKRVRGEFLRYVKNGHGQLNGRGRDLLQSTDTSGQSWSVSNIYQMENLSRLESEFNTNTGLSIDISKMPRYKSNTPKIPDNIDIWGKKAIDIVSLRHAWEIKIFNYKAPVSTNE